MLREREKVQNVKKFQPQTKSFRRQKRRAADDDAVIVVFISKELFSSKLYFQNDCFESLNNRFPT